MRQQKFPSQVIGKKRSVYGGDVKEKGAKLSRPVALDHDMHLILKSDKAKGSLSLYVHRKLVNLIIREKAKKFYVVIKKIINMGDHLHLTVRALDKKTFGKFLKSITTLIARKITGARRGKRFGRFWQGPAFTRILTSAFESLQLRHYLHANRLEFAIGRFARDEYLDRVNRWIRKLKRLDGA